MMVGGYTPSGNDHLRALGEGGWSFPARAHARLISPGLRLSAAISAMDRGHRHRESDDREPTQKESGKDPAVVRSDAAAGFKGRKSRAEFA
jgi:hypothetical protein